MSFSLETDRVFADFGTGMTVSVQICRIKLLNSRHKRILNLVLIIEYCGLIIMSKNDKISLLKQAIFDENGKDRNVIESISPAFLKYK